MNPVASHWIQTTLGACDKSCVPRHLLPDPVEHPHGAWCRDGSGEGNGMGEIAPWHVGNPESQESIPILPSSCNAISCYIITCQISLLALLQELSLSVSHMLSQPATQSST